MREPRSSGGCLSSRKREARGITHDTQETRQASCFHTNPLLPRPRIDRREQSSQSQRHVRLPNLSTTEEEAITRPVFLSHDGHSTPRPVFPSPKSYSGRKRRSREARGYGPTHRLIRDQWALIVAGGMTRCARCDGLIVPGSSWDLDHRDDRRGYLGPSHSTCNRSTTKKRLRSRKW
jgi:hypothetical protein